MPPVLEASACGKCVLFGEHSVLHGGTALSLPLKQISLRITFSPGPKNGLKLSGLTHFPGADSLFWKLIESDFADLSANGVYEIHSEIPLGAGLGSSAALCVALHRLHRPGISLNELIDRSWKSERVFHGRSSGMDPCTIAVGKCLIFKSPTDYEELSLEKLKEQNAVFVILDSEVRRSSEQGINIAKDLRSEDPQRWNRVLENLVRLAREAVGDIKNGSLRELGTKMNWAHECLRDWGLSIPQLERLRDQCLSYGALGAKITGAGRGGFLLSLFRRDDWIRLAQESKAGKDSWIRSGFFELRF